MEFVLEIIIVFTSLNLILLMILLLDKKVNNIKLYVEFTMLIYSFYGLCISSSYFYLYFQIQNPQRYKAKF